MTPVDPDQIADRVQAVRDRLAAAGGDTVKLIAVTKTFGADAVDAVVRAGVSDIGENYAQEAVAKLSDRPVGATVHFIGRLQRNKVRVLAPWVNVWQTVDRAELATEIAKRSPGASVMLQVDISDEEAKGGIAPTELGPLIDWSTGLGLEVIGLMGMAILAQPAQARPGFRLLRSLVDRYGLAHCSMGMTNDLEIAVEEGATMVRIGRDILGKRLT